MENNLIRAIKTLFILSLVILFVPQIAGAQGVTGQVLNEDAEPIPYSNIFIQELGTGTSSDEQGKFYLKLITKGDYRVIISAIGYNSIIDTIIVGDEILDINYQLSTSTEDLSEIVVKANKRDPAFAIIRKVIDNKKAYQKSLNSYRAQVYIKATEAIENLKAPKEKKKKDSDEEKPVDPFEAAEIEKKKLIAGLNMVEMELQLNYQYPKKYKEERTAYKLYGSKDGLYLPIFGDADFNFYNNLVDFGGMTETKIISPLSNTAILSYRYKLEETLFEEGRTVYKIKVIPRKVGNATCSGILFINADIWNINRLDLKLEKGGLRIFDALRIEQTYNIVGDDFWIPTRQAFIYQTKQGNKKKFKGQTTIKYSTVEPNYTFSEKFFNNELAVTTAEAYERDSTYWKNARIEPLTEKETEVVAIRDSIDAVLNSKSYKDSIQAAYNKVTLQDVVWDGVGFRNHVKQRQLYFGSLPAFIDFEVLGGLRLGPYVSFFKRWKSGKYISTYTDFNIGLENKDINGEASIIYRYDPHRLADVWFNFGRQFYNIYENDAYLNQLRASNYILIDVLNGGHRFEIYNGLYFTTSFAFAKRKSAAPFDTGFLNGIITPEPAREFDPYDSFITDFELSFTPAQKYLTEPKRKIILGSKWPTFKLGYKKGWNKIFKSEIDFDFLYLGINQRIEFGAIGNSRYQVEVGKYLNTADLRFVDTKRIRQSDPILFSQGDGAFQALDTSLLAVKPYLEVHYIHHFDGALINNIPIVKLTNIRVVAGGGFLYLQENNFRHEELFAGLERVFKLGARRRLRLGGYGVFANSNKFGVNTSFKVSIDLIDTWKKDWTF